MLGHWHNSQQRHNSKTQQYSTAVQGNMALNLRDQQQSSSKTLGDTRAAHPQQERQGAPVLLPAKQSSCATVHKKQGNELLVCSPRSLEKASRVNESVTSCL
eukprot:3234908-Amphidinium_carterae.1